MGIIGSASSSVNGKIGLEIYDDRGEELLLHQDGIRAGALVVDVEIRSAYSFEHVYKPDEETYFHRPAGLY